MELYNALYVTPIEGGGQAGNCLQGVAAPSVRKPTVAYWAQCRGSGRPKLRGPFHPFDALYQASLGAWLS
jgi:hypothetical protein